MNVHLLRVQDFSDLDLRDFSNEAEQEGFVFVRRLIDDWHSGRNRFDAEGEAFYAAFVAGRLAGVGGLNVDPYSDDPRIGRVRHVYVAPSYRRCGIGRTLVLRIIAHARGNFDWLTLRTNTAGGSQFYRALGFVPDGRFSQTTHCMKLDQTSAKPS